jgi:site-specific recombinase XerD
MDLVTTNTPNATPAKAYIASLRTDTGKRGMMSAINTITRLMGADDWQAINWATLNAANVRAIMAKATGAPATRNKILSALKGIARMGHELHLIDGDTVAMIERVHGDKGTRLPAGRAVDAGEVLQLIKSTVKDDTAAGYRDTAIIALLRQTGMRRAELAGLTMADITVTDDRATLRIIGKGDKERMAYLRNGAYKALRDWLAIRGSDAGHVFCAINKGGVLTCGAGMSTTAIHLILQKRVDAAGIDAFTAHDLRRTFASDLLDAGQDIVTVAGLMGHSSVTTTQRYDRRGERARESAAAFISVPYAGRRA